jgi:hypothetical protein
VWNTPKIGKDVIGGRTIFFPPTYQKYADIISIRSPEEARFAARTMLEEFNKAKTRAKKRRLKSMVVLAANRAKVMRKKEDLSRKEKAELVAIERIYRRTAEQMKL